MGRVGLYSSVIGVAPSAVARSLETRQTRSSGRARTGQEGLANTLAAYRSQERDQKQKNDEGKVLRAGWATLARNSDRGEKV
jgi:hypothetical protein